MEILVALAIIGIIIAITAAALGGRATTTRLGAVANQIAQTIQGRQQLFINDLRDTANPVDMEELAAELGTVFSNSTIIDGDSTVANTPAGITGYDTAGMDACAASGLGIKFSLEAGLTDGEVEDLQAQIQTAVDSVFANPPANGGYTDVLSVTSGTATSDPAAASTTHVHICFGN